MPSQCSRVSPEVGACIHTALEGKKFCGLHLCPTCGAEKASRALGCSKCVEKFTAAACHGNLGASPTSPASPSGVAKFLYYHVAIVGQGPMQWTSSMLSQKYAETMNMWAEKCCKTKGCGIRFPLPILGDLLGLDINTSFKKSVETEQFKSDHRQELQIFSETIQKDVPKGEICVLLTRMAACGYELQNQQGVVHVVVDNPFPCTFSRKSLQLFLGKEKTDTDNSFDIVFRLLGINAQGASTEDIEKQISVFTPVRCEPPQCPRCAIQSSQKTNSLLGRWCSGCKKTIKYNYTHNSTGSLIHSWQCPRKCVSWDLCCCCASTC
mmetsp:Transcript_54309/g.96532  ORF Transcript_54309/g.96532 Transcript_54309/m.96532 type:complete len:323 (-) Transcript_54309:623-1591(-)